MQDSASREGNPKVTKSGKGGRTVSAPSAGRAAREADTGLEFQSVREFLAYVNLGPQVREAPPWSQQVKSRSGESRTIQLYGDERAPWGPTAPAPEAAYRAGRMLSKVLELPRDRPLLADVAGAVHATADRRDIRVFTGAWIVLHAIAFRVTGSQFGGNSIPMLRTAHYRIEYPQPGSLREWRRAHEALEALVEDVLPLLPDGRSTAEAVRSGRRGRGGRPRSSETQAHWVRDLLLKRGALLTAKGIKAELARQGIEVGNARYAAGQAVDRFPQDVGRVERNGEVLFGPRSQIECLQSGVPRRSPT